MKLSVYIKRLLCDKSKLFLILILLVIPLLDIGQILRDLAVNPELPPPDPRYASFSALYTVGTNHFLHKIMFWFLPVFLTIIVGEAGIEDHDLGYNYVVISRLGKKKYLEGEFRNAFLVSFAVIAASLLLNYVILLLLFDYGGHVPMEIEEEPADTFYGWLLRHPVSANLINITLCSAFAGVIGWIGAALAVSLHDRKLVYGITFFVWFVFVQMDGGLMYILHPFTTMELIRFVGSIVIILGGYVLLAAAVTAMEM